MSRDHNFSSVPQQYSHVDVFHPLQEECHFPLESFPNTLSAVGIPITKSSKVDISSSRLLTAPSMHDYADDNHSRGCVTDSVPMATGVSLCATDSSLRSSTLITGGTNTISSAMSYKRHFECGLFSWRPIWLSRFRNMHCFIMCFCLVSCLNTTLGTGYLTGVITTMEKRFNLGSSLLGLVISSSEFGSIVSVLFVSYLGSNKRIPVWVANGCLVMAIGAFIFCLPQFTAEAYSPGSPSVDFSVKLCTNFTHQRITLDSKSGEHCKQSTSNTFVMFLFILANILIGCGGSPILTLGTTFIDDHVTPEESPPFIASSYASSAIGPIFGYLLASVVMYNIYVDGYNFNSGDLPINSSNPEWIGAWWAGFIIIGFCLVLVSLPLFLFPRHLPLSQLKSKVHHIETSASLSQTDAFQPLYSQSSSNRSKMMSFTASDKNNNSSDNNNNNNNEVLVSTPTSDFALPVVPDVCFHNENIINSTLNTLSEPLTSSCSRFTAGLSNDDGVNDFRFLFNSNKKQVKTWRDFMLSVLNLLCNKVYIITCTAVCFEMALVNGFAFFLPKYLEHQFDMSKPFANVLIGSVAVPCAGLGIMTGGLILKRLGQNRLRIIYFVVVINVIIILIFLLLFFVGCDIRATVGINVKYAEVTKYYSRNGDYSIILENQLSSNDLNAACNANCACDPNNYNPVCLYQPALFDDTKYMDFTFLSPCYAGCSIKRFSDLYIGQGYNATPSRPVDEDYFSACTCINNNDSITDGLYLPATDYRSIYPSVSNGACPVRCRMLYVFMVFGGITVFLVGMTQNPILMVTLRSVEHHQRAFALGFQFVIMRLFGYIPSPITFGRVMDATCVHWKSECAQRGACLLYDKVQQRYKIWGLALGLKVGSLLVYFILLYWLKRECRERRQTAAQQVSSPQIMDSVLGKNGVDEKAACV